METLHLIHIFQPILCCSSSRKGCLLFSLREQGVVADEPLSRLKGPWAAIIREERYTELSRGWGCGWSGSVGRQQMGINKGSTIPGLPWATT